jgi:RND family efflux transporter MFP subunit
MKTAPLCALLSLLGALTTAMPVTAGQLVLQPVEVAETKALFGQIESRFVVPARSRIGGLITTLDVTEGDTVKAGQIIARVVDDKLALQLSAADARLNAAQSELDNAQKELARSEALLKQGSTTLQAVDRVRTLMTVARNAVSELESSKLVIQQQMLEGDVIAPSAGRVLSIPTRLGEVILSGEPVATIAAGNVFLRLAIPERHADGLDTGTRVTIGDGSDLREGRIEKIYPLIENGRVTVDVAVDGLPDTFVGQRVLVHVQIGSRQALVVPQAAIQHRSGLDLVTISGGDGTQTVTVVPGASVDTSGGPMVEILSGLRSGDTVIVP